MNPIEPTVKRVQDEAAVSAHIAISHFCTETILETVNGDLFSVIKLEGVPFETEPVEVINQCKTIWHNALVALDSHFSLLGTLHRRKVDFQLAGEFSNAFSKRINENYLKAYRQSAMYVNDIYLVINYKSFLSSKQTGFKYWFKSGSQRYLQHLRQVKRQQGIKQLQQATSQLLVSLSAFKPQLLDKGLIRYVSLVINAGQSVAIPSEQFHAETDLSTLISKHRLFFGNYIQFQGALKPDLRFAAMVSIKRYCSDSASIMLDPMLRLDGEFIATHSFTVASKSDADKLIQRHTNKMQNVEDAAVSQIQALASARDMLASDQMVMGYHHNSIMLLADDFEQLDGLVAETIKCYMNAGIVAVRETLGQEAAFWAQLPGNQKYIARASVISSRNYSDFFPLHNYRNGYYHQNHLGSALTVVETPARTPMWFNLHTKGPLDNPSPGHTTLIGGNGCGKTVAMCFLDAQLNRYAGRSWFFDRNRGAEIYIRACGGHYAVLSPNHADTIEFNPLQLKGTARNRQFCMQWLVQLVKKEGEIDIPETVVADLQQCIDYVYDQLAPQYRNLTNATKILPITFERWLRLRRWLRSDGIHPDGEYAYLFDHDTDALHIADKMAFDMTHFLDNEPPSVLAAVSMYLFYRMECQLDGRLTSVFMDEAWQYLDNPYWQNKIKKWLPTLRKLNCHVILATQSPKSVIDSTISHIILDNCATHLYFANPQAKAEDYINGFNLTQSEFIAIKSNESQSRLMLYKQGHESSLITLNLSGLGELLPILSATQTSINRLDEIRRVVGNRPDEWLPLFLNGGGSHANATADL
ncbi:MAG: VirB4 family type IV secretion/conjugal transfer ATPase [Coxiellaceae bacterium]|nr:VirB4 family type IV secretion/conjugal transfer ATPase [Coxiellaceae bacterium]